MRADDVYAILKGKIVKLTEEVSGIATPLLYKGSVTDVLQLPTSAKVGWMYNISEKSIYGEAGMNVAWTGEVWDSLGPTIDMSLYLKSTDMPEWSKQPNKPTYTAEEVDALPADTKIPSKTSDLQNDSKFLTEVPDIYPTKEEVKKEYQPKGDYVTKTAADAAYQPTGNYLESVPQATAELLGGIKASAKTANETVEAKIDPDTGKMYVPELPGSEDLSKEETAQKILAKLQELLPLIEQVASNGIASSVNGFSFLYGTDGSVTMTYTPDGSSEAETALLPTGTTQTKIAQATKEIVASLKMIAGKDEVTA